MANFKSKEENSSKNFSSKSSEVQSILSHILWKGQQKQMRVMRGMKARRREQIYDMPKM